MVFANKIQINKYKCNLLLISRISTNEYNIANIKWEGYNIIETDFS